MLKYIAPWLTSFSLNKKIYDHLKYNDKNNITYS